MSGLTYDTGALLAAEAGRRDVWQLHEQALERGRQLTVPAGVLGQAWRGGGQANLARFLRGCHVEDLTEARARSAGIACARSGTSDIVDASVAIGALARNDVVITSDSDDILRIVHALGRELRVRRI